MRRLIGAGLMVILAVGSQAGLARAEDPPTVLLWPEGAPGAVGNEPVDRPLLTVYLPERERATGAAVVICPGGGYQHLAPHEGKPVAEWLNGLGVAGFVLTYRLAPRYHHPAMLQDASRAIRLVRARSADWGVDPGRVAIMGFSAGGHLASTAGTHFDAGNLQASDPIERQSSRPDRMILAYPVIALATPYAHAGSRRNLLGEKPPAELLTSFSNETQVTAQTPPAFLVHTAADKAVPPENSLLFAMAMSKAGVPFELHLFEQGRHGLGLGGGDPAFSAWPALCATWLKNQGFLKK
jgi:acetyl esterase/lipase